MWLFRVATAFVVVLKGPQGTPKSFPGIRCRKKGNATLRKLQQAAEFDSSCPTHGPKFPSADSFDSAADELAELEPLSWALPLRLLVE